MEGTLCSVDVLEAEPLFLHKVRIYCSHVSGLLSFNSHFERELKIDFVGFKKMSVFFKILK